MHFPDYLDAVLVAEGKARVQRRHRGPSEASDACQLYPDSDEPGLPSRSVHAEQRPDHGDFDRGDHPLQLYRRLHPRTGEIQRKPGALRDVPDGYADPDPLAAGSDLCGFQAVRHLEQVVYAASSVYLLRPADGHLSGGRVRQIDPDVTRGGGGHRRKLLLPDALADHFSDLPPDSDDGRHHSGVRVLE